MWWQCQQRVAIVLVLSYIVPYIQLELVGVKGAKLIFDQALFTFHLFKYLRDLTSIHNNLNINSS